MITENIIETIRRYNMIKKGQHIVIGLSGGPDSVCLFDVLQRLSMEWELKLYPVHINHKFRPGDAENDQAFAEELCRGRGLECRSFVVDCAELAKREKITSEEAGRMARYSAFAKVADEIEESGVSKENIKIAVAQNLDDLAETVLFRILRGTGTDGLAGISYVRKDQGGRDIIRPIMDISKAQIMRYCDRRALNPCIDKTNLQPIYSRNKLRLNLIPQIEAEYNPNFKEALCRLSESARFDREYMLLEAEKALEKCTKYLNKDTCEILLDGNNLRSLHEAIRRRALALAIEKIGMQGDMSYVHYKNMETLVFSEKPSASSDLPCGYIITRVYEDVAIKKAVSEVRQEAIISKLPVCETKARNDSKRYFFDFDKLCDVYGDNVYDLIQSRERGSGDYLKTKGGTKKLQNLFVDMKVPKSERDKALICAIGKEALVVKPLKSQARCTINYRVDDSTKTVICIEFRVLT